MQIRYAFKQWSKPCMERLSVTQCYAFLSRSNPYRIVFRLSRIVCTPIRYAIIHLRGRRGATSLCYRNRTEITPYCVCTETLSGVVFVPVQKLSGIVSTRPKVQNKFPCRDKQNHKEFWWKVFIQIVALRIFPKPSNFNQIACIAILFALARFEQRDSGNCCAYTAHLNASFKTRITVAQSKDSQNIYTKDFEEPYWKWCN